MKPYRFAIVGAGWRTEFFLRIVQALPERFHLAGLVVRNAEKGSAVEREWGHRTFRAIDDLLAAEAPEFWVSSVSYGANFEMNRALLATGLPILTETPPAATLEQMRELWTSVRESGAGVQVAEQFHRQPHHAARLAAVRQGRIGPVHTAYYSLCHGYHQTSLIRRALGIGFEEARIAATGWKDRVLDPGGRSGPPADAQVREEAQQIAFLSFESGQQALFDFVGVQYFSPIRRQRVCLRGELGEIVDDVLYTQTRDRVPRSLRFEPELAGLNGNLEGFHLKGIRLGEEWIYANPTAPARLSYEEIAMADMLQRMGDHVRGGPEVYSLAEALQDHYLGLMIRQACESGEPVTAKREVWARA